MEGHQLAQAVGLCGDCRHWPASCWQALTRPGFTRYIKGAKDVTNPQILVAGVSTCAAARRPEMAPRDG